jgi:hypothetical protein
MKKKTGMIVTTIVACVMLLSCKKNSNSITPAPDIESSPSKREYTGISVKYGMLAFDNTGIYRDALDFQYDEIADSSHMYDPEKANDWITFSNGQSFSNLLSDDSFETGIEDESFRSVLNLDGCVKIGRFIIKINIPDSNAYVLQEPAGGSSTGARTALLALDDDHDSIAVVALNNDMIQLFEKFEEDAPSSTFKAWWEASKDDYNHRMSELFCGEAGCGCSGSYQHVNMNTQSGNGDEGWMDCGVEYNRYGIWFSLLWQVKSASNTRTLETHVDPWRFKVKCGYQTGVHSYWNEQDGSLSSSPHKKHFYQNVQPLAKFHLRVVFMAKRANKPDYSADIFIKKGY